MNGSNFSCLEPKKKRAETKDEAPSYVSSLGAGFCQLGRLSRDQLETRKGVKMMIEYEFGTEKTENSNQEAHLRPSWFKVTLSYTSF